MIDWQNVLEHLVPIAGTLNMHRRRNDDPSFKGPMAQVATSVAVALIIGLASGGLSSFVTIKVMSQQISELERRVGFVETRLWEERKNHVPVPR